MAQEKASPSPVANGNVIRETLPWPTVYYPNLHGTFFAFAQDKKSGPALCTCAEPAVHHLLGMRPTLRMKRGYGETPQTYFPDVMARAILGWNGRTGFPVPFLPHLCHQCNAVAPTLRYCDETYGSPFTQRYGWYVNQAYLRLGMLPYRHVYLAGICPPDYQADIETAQSIEREFQQACNHLLDLILGSKTTGLVNDSYALLHDVYKEEVARMIELRWRASERRRELKKKVEFTVSQEFGMPNYDQIGA